MRSARCSFVVRAVDLILTGDQQTAQNLANGRLGYCLHEDIVAWPFEISEAGAAAPLIELESAYRRSAAHEGGDAFAPTLIRNAGDRHLGDRRMEGEHTLDVTRRNVLSAGD